MLSRNVLLSGAESGQAPRTELQAGPLQLVFQNGDLRYIRLGEKELLRRVYAAVRDHNWGTVPAKLSNLKIDSRRDRFRVSYQSDHVSGAIHFRWQALLTGAPDGRIKFSFDGVAVTSFKRNRIGFCVHHPLAGFAGRPCEVETAKGGWTKGNVPAAIAPHQPFLDIKAIRHEAAPGCQFEVRFEGETFEMEDHRNWTDGNFKTYGTPLSLPFPVDVPAGTSVKQKIVLSLIGAPPRVAARSATKPAITVQPAGQPAPLPQIGIAASAADAKLSAKQLDRLRALGLSYLRVEESTWNSPEVAALGLPLEVMLLLGARGEQQLRQAAALARERKWNVKRWIVCEEKEIVTTAAIGRMAKSILGGAPVIGATRANFTEINRGRPTIGAFDGVAFPINPQVHAFDNASLAENCAAQRDVILSAKAFLGATPLFVSPVTFRQQFNAVATGPEPPPAPGTLPGKVDARQMSLFGAAWTLASVKYLAESGAAGVTYFESAGWKGVMETEGGSPSPQLFRSIPGSVFPIWHLLADVGEMRGGQVQPSVSSQPLEVESLILRAGGKQRILLANLSDESRMVELPSTLVSADAKVRLLHAPNAEAAMTDPESFRTPRATPVAPGGASGGAPAPVTRRAILAGGTALLRPRNGTVQLTLDACAIACIDS
ncbi:MAG: hypothetical protein FJW30_16835 [Acidobacteria bacterium]|nr:hypothetical protein [Acidobacteriota bacterium]